MPKSVLGLSETAFRKAIWVVSFAIPLVVVVLLQLPRVDIGVDTTFIPRFNALLNTSVTVLLTVGYFLIRRGQREAHRKVMLSAFVLSVLFLVSYVVYHLTHEEVRFGGTGWVKALYLFILITHIGLSVFIVPLALFTLYPALLGRYANHRRLARWTLPLWLYVSVTGVLVYLFLSPYYPT
ncbi:MAG: putative membrane protein YozB [Bacteroidia bacterium]|nr:MAG: putative membrane protein YozB [Bacteroidia bacterium]